MWYPEIETGFHRGTCVAVNSIMSVTIRTAGAGEHAHRPQPAAIHRGIHAARVRVLAGVAELLRIRARHVGRRVERLHGKSGERLETHVALGRLLHEVPVRLFLPAFAVVAHALPPSTARAMTSFWICEVPS